MHDTIKTKKCPNKKELIENVWNIHHQLYMFWLFITCAKIVVLVLILSINSVICFVFVATAVVRENEESKSEEGSGDEPTVPENGNLRMRPTKSR